MKMRPYQDAAIAGAFEAWKEAASALIVLPTGLGKTVVFSEVIRRFQPTRAIVIAHREELIFQAAEKIKKVTGLDGGIEMGGFRAAPVQANAAKRDPNRERVKSLWAAAMAKAKAKPIPRPIRPKRL